MPRIKLVAFLIASVLLVFSLLLYSAAPVEKAAVVEKTQTASVWQQATVWVLQQQRSYHRSLSAKVEALSEQQSFEIGRASCRERG